MTYQQTIDYLFSRLPMYQRKGKVTYKADIGNIVAASDILKNPQKKFKSIHVAGTNGKGSVAHMLASIFQEEGYKVGLYTSPHLKDFRERIKINGGMITKSEIVKFVSKNKTLFEHIDLSFFEFTVALAFNHFATQNVEIAIIETGLGGRLDSTNIIIPELSVITNISLDHTNLLGNTLEMITREKAGIIKKNVPVIIGRKQAETETIFREISFNKKARLIYSDNQNNYKTDLKGDYQKENISTTITAIKELKQQGWKISTENTKNGLINIVKNNQLLGRWQILNTEPTIICDIGHNEDGIKAIRNQLGSLEYNTLHIVFGMVNDKNINNILKLLPKEAIYYFCQADIERALEASKLRDKGKKIGLKGNIHSTVKKALYAARKKAKKDDLIFIGGSTFVVAEVL